MDYKRIMIIGCSGSGKSTLAKKLGSITNIPVVHLDNLYWRSDWKPVSNETFDELLHHELTKEIWIIDGNYNRTLSKRIDFCDTVVYLDFPRLTCLGGVLRRSIAHRGQSRSDMRDNVPKFFDFQFLQWIWRFNKENRDKYCKMLGNSNKQVFILHKHKDIIALVNQYADKR